LKRRTRGSLPRDESDPRPGGDFRAGRTHDLAQPTPHAIAIHGSADSTGGNETDTHFLGWEVLEHAQDEKLPMKRLPLAPHPLELRGAKKPGGLGKATGGQSQYIENFARAGVACGVDAVFMEVHENPAKAPSDGPNQLPLERLEPLLAKLKQIHKLVNEEQGIATNLG